MSSLLDEINRQWGKTRAEMDAVNRRVNRFATRERAEVAASVPLVPTVGDLPASGQIGELHAVEATGRLYLWNGSAWEHHVADSVRDYGTAGSLPTGASGDVAAADDQLYHHDGTAWRPHAPFYIVGSVGDVPSPYEGVLAYVTTLNKIYFYDGSAWHQVTST